MEGKYTDSNDIHIKDASNNEEKSQTDDSSEQKIPESWKRNGYAGRVEQSEDDKLLAKATSVVYQTIVKDLDTFVALHGEGFANLTDNEHKLEWTQLHQDFEKIIENSLEKFCKAEGLVSTRELYTRIQNCTEANDRSEKLLKLLLAATEYNKFVKIMKNKVKKMNFSKK